MSTLAPREDAFRSVLRQAGAVFAEHDGRLTAVNYGSAAGELAVCLRAVGLLDRSDLTKLELEGPPERLSALLQRLAGTDLAPGGVVAGAAITWCRADEERAIVICEPSRSKTVSDGLRMQARRHGSITLRDQSETWGAIGVIGRLTPSLLAALGVYGDSGDPRQVPPFTRSRIGETPVSWLLESPRKALALLRREQAATAWRTLEEVGRPFAISCVGHQAAARYSIIDPPR